MNLKLGNPALGELRPFLVAVPEVLATLERSPFGFRVADAACFDPLSLAATALFERLRALDQATFGAEGMPMARWIFLDGAGLTGAIFGLGRPAEATSPAVLEALSLPTNAKGIVPYSMYIALPSFEPSTWVGHNLASIGVKKPAGERLHGLGSLTKALGLKVFRAHHQLGAAQWDAPALRVHARLGPLRLLSAWTPAHSKAWTYTYLADIDDERLMHLARDRRAKPEYLEPERWLDSSDHQAMRELQRDIENGAEWVIAGTPEPLPSDENGRRQRVGLARVTGARAVPRIP